MNIRPANGQEGILIWCGGDRYVFRIYHSAPHDFTDYDIKHSDMRVVIKDSDAYFYEDGNSARVDHSPETLGLK